MVNTTVVRAIWLHGKREALQAETRSRNLNIDTQVKTQFEGRGNAELYGFTGVGPTLAKASGR